MRKISLPHQYSVVLIQSTIHIDNGKQRVLCGKSGVSKGARNIDTLLAQGKKVRQCPACMKIRGAIYRGLRISVLHSWMYFIHRQMLHRGYIENMLRIYEKKGTAQLLQKYFNHNIEEIELTSTGLIHFRASACSQYYGPKDPWFTSIGTTGVICKNCAARGQNLAPRALHQLCTMLTAVTG